MRLKLIPIPSQLAHLAKSFWILESNATDIRSFRFEEYTMFANPYPSLVIQYAGQGFLKVSLKEKTQFVPRFHFYGQSQKPVDLVSSGNFGMIGIHFYPYTTQLLFGCQAQEVTDQVLDLKYLFGKKGRDFITALSSAKTSETCIHLLCTFLSKIASTTQKPDPIIAASLSFINANKGQASIDRLCQYLGYSPRQVERKFNQLNGMSPKLFSRITRFEAVIKNFRYGNYQNLTQLAMDSGYADQSHFIREFRAFSSLSPKQYFKGNLDIAATFVKHASIG